MATYSKLIVDLSPDLYTSLCDLAIRHETSKAKIVRGLIEAHLLEIESHPSGKMFAAKSKLRKTIKK